jgi:hypothetical protein
VADAGCSGARACRLRDRDPATAGTAHSRPASFLCIGRVPPVSRAPRPVWSGAPAFSPGGAWRLGEKSPQQAIADFATLYINWTAKSLTSQLALLALASVGQARMEMSLAATSTGKDQDLHVAGMVNSGTVEAVVPLPGGLRRWVVVTRERTRARASSAYTDLAPAWHVTVATVVRLATGRWVVSGWQPES